MRTAEIPGWLEFPDVDKPYVEQIHGRREPKVSPKRRHAILQARLTGVLARWAADRGEVGTEWRCYLIDGEERPSSLVPDASYFSFARLPRVLEEDARERPRVAPDIAVEIVSPGDRTLTLEEKIALHLRHGASVVVVVHPEKRTIALHRPEGSVASEARGLIAVAPFGDLVIDCDELFRGL